MDFDNALLIGGALGGAFALARGMRMAGLKMGGGKLLSGGLKKAAAATASGAAKAYPYARGALTGRGLAPAAMVKGSLVKKYPGLIGGMAKYGAGMLAAYGMGKLADTEGMAPAASAALKIGAFSAKFGAYRNLLRGGAGTAFAAAERITGRRFDKSGAFVTNTLLGGVTQRGSLVNKAVMGTVKGVGGFIAKAPIRIGTGLLQTPFAAGRAVRSMFGFGSHSVVGALEPEVLGRGFWNKGPRRAAFAKWAYNKSMDAPIGHGMFALAGTAGLASSYYDARAAQESPYSGPNSVSADSGPPNPAMFGGGISGMRRGTAPNDESLTLQLHRNNTRVMP
jgi:hypothetical protein